jgi:hypothetical protein
MAPFLTIFLITDCSKSGHIAKQVLDKDFVNSRRSSAAYLGHLSNLS